MAVVLIYLEADKAAFCCQFFFRVLQFFKEFKLIYAFKVLKTVFSAYQAFKFTHNQLAGEF